MTALVRARIAGVFYLLDIVTSVVGDTALHGTQLGITADRFATACYVVVTVLLFSLLSVVNRALARLMAFFSLLSLTIWTFGHVLWNGSATDIGNVTFGVYLMIAGYLIFQSIFLPRVVGAAVAFGGLALLSYVSPPLVARIYPFNAIPALIGETSLMLWLLLVGVSARRWEAMAGRLRARGEMAPGRGLEP